MFFEVRREGKAMRGCRLRRERELLRRRGGGGGAHRLSLLPSAIGQERLYSLSYYYYQNIRGCERDLLQFPFFTAMTINVKAMGLRGVDAGGDSNECANNSSNKLKYLFRHFGGKDALFSVFLLGSQLWLAQEYQPQLQQQ